MKKHLILLLLFIFTIFTCDWWTSIDGHVYDINNNPIDNVLIELNVEDVNYNTQSDENGYFTIVSDAHGNPQPMCGSSDEDKAIYTASKAGYQTTSGEFPAGESESIEIILLPAI